MGLKHQAISGVKWTSVSAVVSAVFQLLQVAVLARFLDKNDFGLMAMALFVIGISGIFIDMGISNALIHKQRINKFQLSTLFWLNIFLGVVIFGVILIISPWVSKFYKAPELQSVINWVAVTFLIIPFGQQFESLMRRDFKFKDLAVRDMTSKTIAFIVAVVLAYQGAGVYSLIFANLAGALVGTILLLFWGVKNFAPRFIFSSRSLKSQGFYSFGLFQMGEKFINYFNANFDTILIGKLLGMEALGLYNIAKTLVVKPYQIINPIITKVAFPTFAKVQNDIPLLKRSYLKVVEVLSLVNAPVYFLMIILAKPLISVVFGSEWLAAVPIIQLLAIGSLCDSVGNPVGSLQLARGKANWGFYWTLTYIFLIPNAIYIGSFWGLIGIALSLAILKMITVLFLAWYFFIRVLCDTRYFEYTRSYMKPFLLTLLSGIIPCIICFYIENLSVLIQIIIVTFVFIILYLFMNLWLNKSNVQNLIQMLNFKPINKLKSRLIK